MPQIQFHETRMGAYFLERTMPEMVKQLTRVADALERMAGEKEPLQAAQSEASVPSADENPLNAPAGQ